MKISFSSTHIGFSSSVQTVNKKEKDYRTRGLLIGGGVLLTCGLIALANYNRPNVVKKAVEDVGVVRKKNFLELCQNSKLEDYVASVENIDNKVFRMDLHSHSNHSDGRGKVVEILDQVATYADEMYAKTKKKFVFALTDHDGVSGVKEADEIIKNNPEKYKNIEFVPGVELSFAFNSNGQVKSGEMLAYFVDPDSKAMKILVEDLRQNRNNMIDKCIKNLGEGFSREDLDNYFLRKDGETFAYNLHYRLRNYAQIKNRVNKMAVERGENGSNLYKRLMDGYVFEKGRVPKSYVAPDGFDKYLQRNGIKTDVPMIDDSINNLCEEFFPKIVDGKVVSDTENSFEKIIDILKDEENVVLGFAHPYFTAKQMTDYKKEFGELLKYADGKIQLSENYHQAYRTNIPKEEIDEVNQFLLDKNLIPIGGRDNHSNCFF